MVEEEKEQREREGSFSIYYDYCVAIEPHRFHFTLVLYYARMGSRITGPGL